MHSLARLKILGQMSAQRLLRFPTDMQYFQSTIPACEMLICIAHCTQFYIDTFCAEIFPLAKLAPSTISLKLMSVLNGFSEVFQSRHFPLLQGNASVSLPYILQGVGYIKNRYGLEYKIRDSIRFI